MLSLGLSLGISRPLSAQGASIVFSPSVLSIADAAAPGSLIATASVNNFEGTPTFTLTDSAGGQFALASGDQLTVGLTALTAGSQTFTLEADIGAAEPLVVARSVSVNSLPVNTVAAIASGTPEVGEALSVTNGTWTGFPVPTFAYQWTRGGVDIAGANSSTYTLVDADDGATVACDVTGANTAGTAEASSNGIAVTYPSPLFTTPASISGSATVGGTLTADPGAADPVNGVAFSYQWTRDASLISGATAAAYLLVSADEGAEVTCIVTATTNHPTTPTANSTPSTVTVTGAPANTIAPVVSGTAEVGETLSVTNGTWTGFPAPTFTYQWLRDGVSIRSATASTYALVAADDGTTISCRVAGTNTVGSASADSNGVAVAAAGAALSAPNTSGTTDFGSTTRLFNVLDSVTGGSTPYAVTDVMPPGTFAASDGSVDAEPNEATTQSVATVDATGSVVITGIS